MTDKVQKIREEVKKLKSRLIYGACASQIAMETYCKEEAYNEVLAILDSMKEEPVSEDLGQVSIIAADEDMQGRQIMEESNEKRQLYSRIFRRGFKAGAKWKEQKNSIVNEELEEAADNALNNVLNTHEIVNVRSCLEMFRFGAEWQKAKDQSTIELAEDHAMLAGMEKMKEQMIANAFDAEVLENYDGKVIKYDDTILDEKLSGCKVFDKIKVIVIKEK